MAARTKRDLKRELSLVPKLDVMGQKTIEYDLHKHGLLEFLFSKSFLDTGLVDEENKGGSIDNKRGNFGSRDAWISAGTMAGIKPPQHVWI
jgi:hypothetical protein